jgi:uncharacterized protein YnzC (UPF0291/DUF896 family)
MEQKKIDRINELARKSKSTELTEEEKIEQAELRNEYRCSIMGSLKSHLNNCYIVDEKGNKNKVKEKSVK